MLRLTEKGFVSESDLGLILWGVVYIHSVPCFDPNCFFFLQKGIDVTRPLEGCVLDVLPCNMVFS